MPIKSKSVYFKFSDPRTVKVTGGTEFIRDHKADNIITAIELSSGKVFTIGDTLKIDKATIKINIIRKQNLNNSLIYELCIAK